MSLGGYLCLFWFFGILQQSGHKWQPVVPNFPRQKCPHGTSKESYQGFLQMSWEGRWVILTSSNSHCTTLTWRWPTCPLCHLWTISEKHGEKNRYVFSKNFQRKNVNHTKPCIFEPIPLTWFPKCSCCISSFWTSMLNLSSGFNERFKLHDDSSLDELECCVLSWRCWNRDDKRLIVFKNLSVNWLEYFPTICCIVLELSIAGWHISILVALGAVLRCVWWCCSVEFTARE